MSGTDGLPLEAHRALAQRMKRRRSLVILPLAFSMALAAGCSGSDDGDSGTSPPTSTAASGCSEAAALEDSLRALTNVDPLNDGLDALNSAAAEVKTDLDATASAVSAGLEPAVDQVETAFDDLETTLEGITDAGGLGAAASEVGSALSRLGTALTGLSDEIAKDCS